jgi:hypothetical protein
MIKKSKWRCIHEEEIEAINLSRFARQVFILDNKKTEYPEKAHAANLTGIAFSGGGIRSATFNLGILQGLAKLKLLHIFDYLSTVSGGGYIGSWLSAWIFRSLNGMLTPEFTQVEFENNNLKKLCNDFDEQPQTLAELNKLLGKKELYEQIRKKKKDFNLSKELQQLYNIINPPARDKDWSMQPIKCLNRLILEESFQEKKIFNSKQKIIDSSKEALNSVVDALESSGKKSDNTLLNSEQTNNSRPWESKQVQFLRKFSNYLTPQPGLTTDTLTLGVAYSINFVSNLIVLVLLLGAILTLPLIVSEINYWIRGKNYLTLFPISIFVPSAVLLIIGLTCAFSAIKSSTSERIKIYSVIGFVVFFLLTCSSLSILLWQTPTPLLASPWLIWACYTALIFALVLIVSRCLTGSLKIIKEAFSKWQWQPCSPLVCEFVAALVAGFVTGPLLYAAASFMEKWQSDTINGHWQVAVWGLPIVVLIFAAATIVYCAIAGRSQDEYLREWTFRLWAVVVKYTCVIGVLSFIVIYGPLLLMKAESIINKYISTYLTIGWIVSTIGGVLVGHSEWQREKNSRKTVKLVVKIAPYLFIGGTVLFLSWALYSFWIKFIAWQNIFSIKPIQISPDVLRLDLYWRQLNLILDYFIFPFGGFFVLTTAAFFLSWRVGVNEFSLQALYGNRLVRAYLGASNPDSTGNLGNSKRDKITFFNASDNDVRLNFLSSFQDRFVIYPGPFPIINSTINLMKSKNLAWQKRKGASFIFSPLFSGYDRDLSAAETSNGSKEISTPAYVRSNQYSSENGLSLGKAMSISGAAASPNMGYYTTTPLAFLMTVFNIRLGWWLANPIRNDQKLLKSNGPLFGFSYLLKELLAKAGQKSRFVYLSDGGHFENLGIYELVKRRCRNIVACDATKDKEMKFNDLGNAIEKCRTDFGIDILIDVDEIRRQNENGQCTWHCAVGKIRYSNIDKNAPDGTIIYLKASLTGDEPLDIARYVSQYPEFPHQSTADQWFDETQFESYRLLGEHIAHSVFGKAVKNTDVRKVDAEMKDQKAEKMPETNIERLFHELQEQWYPSSEAVLQKFSKHAADIERIISQLKSDKKLRFLDLQIYPVFSQLAQEHTKQKNELRYLPESSEELRAGFYMCKQMLIFMESVYYDLNLDREFNHPDNRGWINLFQQWAWSRMFRFTWSVTASTYGARFQKFCEQYLNFKWDEVQIGLIKKGLPTALEVNDYIIKKYSSQAARPSKATDSQLSAENEYGDDLETTLVVFWKAAEKKYGFNYFERHIIEDMLKNPKMKPCKIFPILIKTADNPLKDDSPCYFNVGFVIMDLEQTRIYYFRIQNHLRQMGLARKSLRVLLSHSSFQQNDIRVEFIEPSSNAPEIVSTDSHLKFTQFFYSVKSEIQK